MPLFGHHRNDPLGNDPLGGGPQRGFQGGAPGGIPGFGDAAFAQGWRPLPAERPFDGHLEDAVHEITRAMYGAPRSVTTDRQVGQTFYRDAFRGSVDGRAVIVANAWTGIEPLLFQGGDGMCGVSVCAVELPAVLPVVSVHPRGLGLPSRFAQAPTGNPAFDERFCVIGLPAGVPLPGGALAGAAQVLAPQVQQRILARGDWVFHAEGYLLGCVTKGPFGSAAEVSQRIGEVLGIVAAIPASVMPARVDHSADDLIARIARIDTLEDAIAFLQHLTPAERQVLARSDTPLAAFADVQTPEEAIARFQSLDPQRRMQILAMFMRVEDDQRLP